MRFCSCLLVCLAMVFPCSAQQPVPADAETLLKAVVANQKQLEETRRNYIFHRRDEQQDADEQGNVKKTTVSEYEVFFIGGWEIDRLLTRNGKPLDDHDKHKQDEEVAKQEKRAAKISVKKKPESSPIKTSSLSPSSSPPIGFSTCVAKPFMTARSTLSISLPSPTSSHTTSPKKFSNRSAALCGWMKTRSKRSALKHI